MVEKEQIITEGDFCTNLNNFIHQGFIYVSNILKTQQSDKEVKMCRPKKILAN